MKDYKNFKANKRINCEISDVIVFLLFVGINALLLMFLFL